MFHFWVVDDNVFFTIVETLTLTFPWYLLTMQILLCNNRPIFNGVKVWCSVVVTQTDAHTQTPALQNLALYFIYRKIHITKSCNDAHLPITWTVWSTMLVTVCTEIKYRFNRILHFADQNCVPNIANETSPKYYNHFISCLCTRYLFSHI